MTYIMIYGLLVLGTFTVSLAPKTKSLWKIGLVFLVNWVIFVSIFSFNPRQEGVLILFASAACICLLVSVIYKCRTSRYVACVYFAQTLLYLYISFTSPSYVVYTILNILFILNACIIIYSSVKTLLSRNRRWHTVHCFKHDRRINSNQKTQVPYA